MLRNAVGDGGIGFSGEKKHYEGISSILLVLRGGGLGSHFQEKSVM